MAKKIQAMVKLQIAAGKATPAPPVGTALGPHGVNIMDFCKNFNARTAKDEGLIIPVVVTVYADRSYSFITKTPPASILLKRAANLAKGSAEPNKTKVGTVTQQAGRGHRQDQDAGPQLRHARRRGEVRRRHRPLDGHRRHRVAHPAQLPIPELRVVGSGNWKLELAAHRKSGRPRRPLAPHEVAHAEIGKEIRGRQKAGA